MRSRRLSPGPAPNALVDLPRQDRGKLVGEPFQALGLLVHLGYELVIENRRRYGGDKADRGREQRLGDARRHDRERRVLRRRDRLEARHDAPDRAEQADEGAGGADGREHQETALQPLDLARDGDVHDLLDAHLQAGEGSRLAFEGALPLAHRGDEQRRHRMRRGAPTASVEFLQRLAGPERLLEAVHRALGAHEEQRLVDDDRPDPDRSDEQPDHHRLHDHVGLPNRPQSERSESVGSPTAPRRSDS